MASTLRAPNALEDRAFRVKPDGCAQASPTRPALLSMHWSGEDDRLTQEQVALHKTQLRRLSDVQLQSSYEMYLRTLHLEKGRPPIPAMVQYYIECWRELRRRRRKS